MISLLAAFFASFASTLLIIRYSHLHDRFSGDHNLSGPQKFHTASVPRIGGICIMIGILVATLVAFQNKSASTFQITLLLCTIPTFAIGLTEDLTKSVSVRTRIIIIALAAGFSVHYLGAQIPRLDILGLDYLLNIPFIAIVFTVFAITGLTNAYNIIDGFNGLSSMVGVITLMGLAYVSYVVSDALIAHLSLMMASSIMGLFFWNYPKGLIFLGDCGAYLIGFWIAILSILLITRHSEISPWFALLVNGYPILETLFTIYRRMIYQCKSPGKPDGIHLHTLIYRRILHPLSSKNKKNYLSANAKTSPYLWTFSCVAIVPAILWWQSTPMLIMAAALLIIMYLWIYKKIVSFKTPRWMHSF